MKEAAHRNTGSRAGREGANCLEMIDLNPQTIVDHRYRALKPITERLLLRTSIEAKDIQIQEVFSQCNIRMGFGRCRSLNITDCISQMLEFKESLDYSRHSCELYPADFARYFDQSGYDEFSAETIMP